MVIMDVQLKTRERVGDLFESLGNTLRDYLDGLSSDTASDRAEMEKSVRAVISALDEVIVTAGKAVRDPALRKDLTQVVVSVRELLVAAISSPIRHSQVLTEKIKTPFSKAPSITGPKTNSHPAAPRRAATSARKPATTTPVHK
jgi:hypothetical protein